MIGGWISRLTNRAARDRHGGFVRELGAHGELALDLIATADFEGFFTRLNPAWMDVLGYSEQELLSQPFIEFVHPDDRRATLTAVSHQTEAGKPVLQFENRYRHKNGSYRWLEWTSRPDLENRQLVAIARDITDRKQLEEAEQRYKEMLEIAVEERTRELQRRTDQLDEARLELLRRLALAAEYRDDQTFEHAERVGQTSAMLAEQLGLSDEEASVLRQAAPLHDIGKLGVSDTILLKPGKLTPEEFEQVKRHTTDGSAILAGSHNDVLQLAEEIARTHHERWDGTGYPRGLRGTATPLSGRIVALADVYDALTHERPYKHAWTVEEAVDEIHRQSGQQFDPEVVRAFDRLDPHSLAGLRTGSAFARLRVVA